MAVAQLVEVWREGEKVQATELAALSGSHERGGCCREPLKATTTAMMTSTPPNEMPA